MAEEITVIANEPEPVADSKPASDVKIETNYAPSERKSPELSTTEPTTPELQITNDKEPVADTTPEPKAELPQEDAANVMARERFQEKLRADKAEAELAKLKPSYEIPKDAPDINDQSTWGKKYANEPNTLETFLKARDDWKEAQTLDSYKQTQAQEAEAQRNVKIRAEIARKEQLTVSKHPDYYTVIAPVAPIIGNIPILKQYVAERELGTDVAYHLAQNPAMLQQLSTMTPFQAGEFLFSLEGRLKAPAVQVTQAPEPIKPVGSREVTKLNLADLAAKDMNGYVAMRNKQELARKRAH